MKLVDCFTFLNEFDVLKIRLAELAPYVDWFVLVESAYTLSGRPKPLYFKENPIKGYKIHHVVVDPIHINFSDMPALTVQQDLALENERNQRDVGFLAGTEGCDATDLALCSDVDEIPRPSKLWEGPHDSQACFEMKWYNYWLNCECVDPLINPYRGTGRGPVSIVRAFDGGHALLMTRAIPQSSYLIHDGGWHFSCQGGAAKIKEKLRSFAHAPVAGDDFTNEAWVEHCMDTGEDVMKGFYGDRRHHFVSIDDTYPETVTNNLSQYEHMISGRRSGWPVKM